MVPLLYRIHKMPHHRFADVPAPHTSTSVPSTKFSSRRDRACARYGGSGRGGHSRRGGTTSGSHPFAPPVEAAATTKRTSFRTSLVLTASPAAELMRLIGLPVNLVTTMGNKKFSWSPSAESDDWAILCVDESGEFLGRTTLDRGDTKVSNSLVRSVSKSAWDEGLRSTSGGDAADLAETSRTIIRTLCFPQGQKQPMWSEPGDDAIKTLAVSLMCNLWHKNPNAAKCTCKIKP